MEPLLPDDHVIMSGGGGKQPIPGLGSFKIQRRPTSTTTPKKKPPKPRAQESSNIPSRPSTPLSTPTRPPPPITTPNPTFSLSAAAPPRPPTDESTPDSFEDTLRGPPIFETFSQLKQQHPDTPLIKFIQMKAAKLEGHPVVFDSRITFTQFAGLIFMCGNFGQAWEHELSHMKQENEAKYETFLKSIGNLEIFGPNAGSVGVDHMNKTLDPKPMSRLAYVSQTFIDNVILYHSIPKFAAFQQYRSNIMREMFQMGWRLMSTLIQSTYGDALQYAPERYKLYERDWQTLRPEEQLARNTNLTRTAMELHNEIMTLFEMICMGLCEAEFLCMPTVMYDMMDGAGERFRVSGWQYFVTDPLSVIHTQCKVVALQHAKLFGLFYPLEKEYTFQVRNMGNRVVTFMNYTKTHVIDPILLARMPAALVEPVTPSPLAYSSLSSSSSSSYDGNLSSSSDTPFTPTRPYTTASEQYPSPDTVDEDKPHSFAVALHNAVNKLRNILWVLVSDISALKQPSNLGTKAETSRPKRVPKQLTLPTAGDNSTAAASTTSTSTESPSPVSVDTEEDFDVLPAYSINVTTPMPRQQEDAPDPESYNAGYLLTAPLAFGIGDTPVPQTPREESGVGSTPSWL